MADETHDFDVLIVGAGISGINAAYRLQTQLPAGTTYAILESRGAIGGTWDLFKYPGIRSDSDLYTFGFPWRPWTEGKAIAEAPLILKYLAESVRETGIDKHILFRHKVETADWSSDDVCWNLEVGVDGKTAKFSGRFLIFGTGYYDYDRPMDAFIPGLDSFKGQVVHPQFWPEKLEFADKDVAIIGSGATAVTMLPNISRAAKKVTMVQRSPGYVFSLPAFDDPLTVLMRWLLPAGIAHSIIRWRWVVSTYLFFYFCRAFPKVARSIMRTATTKQLPKGFPHDPHFSPAYNPWEQRLCIAPNGDFYKAMRAGKATVVTGAIKTVTADGITLEGGGRVPADVIVTATGLRIKLAGGVRITLDGEPFDIPSKFMWKGVMLQDLPNAAFVIGYTNASWTLGADATAQLCMRLLNGMARRGVEAAVPRLANPEAMTPTPMLNLSSTYIQKALHQMPKAGSEGQWRPRSNYIMDLKEAKLGDIETALEFLPKAKANGVAH